MGTAITVRCLVGVLLSSPLWLTPQASAAASSVEVLNTGEVVELVSPGVALMVPDDGRLSGYGFTSTIAGVAFAHFAGGPSDQPVQAAAGDELVVVSLDENDAAQGDIYGFLGQEQITYTLTAGSTSVRLPALQQNLDTGQQNTAWAVAVPKGSPATLTAAAEGFSQSFDLRSGRRVGTSPLALYRDPTKPYVSETLSAAQDLTATGSSSDPVTLPVSLGEADLVYFKPDVSTRQPPPPVGQAWLVVYPGEHSKATNAAGGQIMFSSTLGSPDLELDSPAGAVHPIELAPQSGTYYSLLDNYAFPVPATFTTGTLKITINGMVPASDAGNEVNLHFADQVATFTITLPPVPALTAGGYLHTSAPAPTRTATSRHHTGIAIWLYAVIAAAVLTLIATIALIYRRRALPALPVGRPTRTLLVGTALPLPASAPSPPELEPAHPVSGAATRDTSGQPASTGTATESPAEQVELILRVLGPGRVEGLTRPIRRRAVQRLLFALGLVSHRQVSVEELRDLIAPEPDHPPSGDDVHGFASKLRACLPAGTLPAIGAGDRGYQFAADVDVDLAVFRALAQAASVAEGPERPELSRRALSLVRGGPLAGNTWEGVADLLRQIDNEIETLAADTAHHALGLRDARSAEWAVGQGLLAIPKSPLLWELRLIAAAGGSGYGLERAWADCQSSLAADAEPLRAVYERLRRGDW